MDESSDITTNISVLIFFFLDSQFFTINIIFLNTQFHLEKKNQSADTQYAGMDLPSHLTLRIAAIRELFEEANILLATKRKGGSTPDRSISSLATEWREKVQKDSSQFYAMVEALDLDLQTHALCDWAHWVTPKFEKYRSFD